MNSAQPLQPSRESPARPGLLARLPHIPGIELVGAAILSLLLGLWLVGTQADLLQAHGGHAASCPLNVDGRSSQLGVGESVSHRGRTITCRQYDGHPVLIYTTHGR